MEGEEKSSAASHSVLSKKMRALHVWTKLQHFGEYLLWLARSCALGSCQLPKGSLP